MPDGPAKRPRSDLEALQIVKLQKWNIRSYLNQFNSIFFGKLLAGYAIHFIQPNTLFHSYCNWSRLYTQTARWRSLYRKYIELKPWILNATKCCSHLLIFIKNHFYLLLIYAYIITVFFKRPMAFQEVCNSFLNVHMFVDCFSSGLIF